VFATAKAADEWFKDTDPEGVAFEYEAQQRGRCRPSDNGRSVAKGAGPTFSNFHTIAAIV